MSRQYSEPSLDLSAFEHDFQLRDASSVLEVIESDPSLVGLLLETRTQIEHWFPDATPFIEVDNDPDVTTSNRLIVSVGTTLDADTAFQALEQFDHTWWLKNLDRAKGKVTVTVEFV